MFKKKKYIAIFLIKEQEIFTVLKRKKFKPSITSITEIKFRDKLYPINISIPTYSNGLNIYYFINTTKVINCQLTFIKNNKNSDITPEILDMLISRKIVHQLTSNLTDTALKMNLVMIFIGLAIGGLLGYIVGGV